MKNRTNRQANRTQWEAHMAQTRAAWAAKAAEVDHDGDFDPTANFTKCATCGVHTRKGVATEDHTARHEAEANAEQVHQGNRVVRV
jgi:hypothetical protein